MATSSTLSPKHRAFAREYIKDKNGGRAYRAIYGQVKGADQSASALLRTTKVAEAVNKALAKLEAKLELSAERNLQRIAEYAYNKPRLKAADVLKACELIGRHFGQFKDIQELTGKDGDPVQVVLKLPAGALEKTKEGTEPESDGSE